MTHAYEVRMRFHEAELWVMVPMLGEKFSFMHVDRVPILVWRNEFFAVNFVIVVSLCII